MAYKVAAMQTQPPANASDIKVTPLEKRVNSKILHRLTGICPTDGVENRIGLTLAARTDADGGQKKRRGWLRGILPALLLAFPTVPAVAFAAAPSQDAEIAQLQQLRAADTRLFGIFWRLGSRNAALCEGAVPAIGALLQARSSYDGDFAEAAQRYFSFESELSVEVVAPDGPADRAGLRPNDSIVAIGGRPLPDVRGPEAVAAAQRALVEAGKRGPIELTVLRGGERKRITISPLKTCSGRVELMVSADRVASTDGDVVQISSGLFNIVPSDAELAAVIAHEYSHLILRHPQRLTDAGVDRGLLAMFGKNRRLIRRTEAEADRLSVYLLLNAGYDPMAAGRFWRNAGRKIDAGFLSDGTHMGWRKRAELLDAEAERARAATGNPVIPDLLKTRDTPLE